MGRNVASFFLKYNSTKHSTTNMTPNEAKREDNKLKIWLNIKNKAELNRKYPPLSVVILQEFMNHLNIRKAINLFGVQRFIRLLL